MIVVLIGTIGIANETTFSITKIVQTSEQKKQTLTAFLPIWSEYHWFSVKQFSQPNRWLKEAQLRLFLIWISFLIFPVWEIGLFASMAMIVRVSGLLLGYDFITQEQKI